MTSFAIIPAAGVSARMGQAKLLLPWGEGRIIDAVLNAWCDSKVSVTVAVLRESDRELDQACRRRGVEVALTESTTADMKASVRLGLGFVAEYLSPAADDVWLVAPADMPQLSSRVIDQVLAAYVADAPGPVVPVYGGRRGHPALFPWSFSKHIDSLGEDEGINVLLRGGDLVEVACDTPDAVPPDVDTPREYNERQNDET